MRLILIFLVCVLCSLFLFGCGSKQQEPIELVMKPPVRVNLKAMDADTEMIIEPNARMVINGQPSNPTNLTKIAWTEFLVPWNTTIEVVCQSDQYYLDMVELGRVKSHQTVMCSPKRIGSVFLEHGNDLSGDVAEYAISIRTDNYLNDIVVCLGWSVGFISAKLPDQKKECPREWVNWTNYDKSTQTYDWLPKGVYRCPTSNEFARCSGVNFRECVLKQPAPPSRILNKVDKCYYTGATLTPEEQELRLDILLKPMTLINQNDYLDVYVIDQESTLADGWWLNRMTSNSGTDHGQVDYYERIMVI